MSTNSYYIHTRRAAARELAIAGVLLATIGLAPVVARAGDATTDRSAMEPGAPERTATGLLTSVADWVIVIHRSAQPDLWLTIDGGTHVALNGQTATVSALREGQEVRASYRETNGDAKAIRVEAHSEDGQPVRVMSPNDPEWNQTHQGG
jgi:hypothetical protein